MVSLWAMLERHLGVSLCNHSNFTGALWQTDNRVREEFLFSSLSLPCFFLPPTCSHFHFCLWQLSGFSHLYKISFHAPGLVCLEFFFLIFTHKVWATAPWMLLTAVEGIILCRLQSPDTLKDPFNCLRISFSQKLSLHLKKAKCALKIQFQPWIPLFIFQRLCCQTMVLHLRLITLRICNA